MTLKTLKRHYTECLTCWSSHNPRCYHADFFHRVRCRRIRTPLSSNSISNPYVRHPVVVLLRQTLMPSVVRTSVHFWETNLYVGQPTAFQLSISMPGNIALSSLSFVSVSIYFSDNALTPLVIRHSDGAPGSDKNVRRVTLGDVSRYLFDIDDPVEGGSEESLQAYLRWGSGVSIVFTGTLQLEVPGVLKLTKVILTVKQNSWWIELPIELNELQNYGDRALETPKWLTSVDPPQYVPVKRGDCTTATYVRDWRCSGKP
jgi:hypothetical protein